MAGNKNSGRRPLHEEMRKIDPKMLLSLSQDVLEKILRDPEETKEKTALKADIAKALYVKHMPTKIEGEGFTDFFKILIQNSQTISPQNRLMAQPESTMNTDSKILPNP